MKYLITATHEMTDVQVLKIIEARSPQEAKQKFEFRYPSHELERVYSITDVTTTAMMVRTLVGEK